MTRASFFASNPNSNARASGSPMPLPISQSSRTPRGGLPLSKNCIANLTEIQAVQSSRRVAEVLHVNAHAVHHCEKEVAHRGLFPGNDAPSALEVASATSHHNCWKVLVTVAIPVGQRGAIHDHAVVQQRRVTLFGGLHFLDPASELCQLIAVDLRYLLHQNRIVAMMRERMVAVGNANLAIRARRAFVRDKESDNARQVRLKSDG